MRIISGGQIGADRTALEVAREHHVETGGVAPLGYLTLDGPDPSLKDFGLVEHPSSQYPPRTKANVIMADATVWFGKVGTSGFHCTNNAATAVRKPFLKNPTAAELVSWIVKNKFRTINIAGNDSRKNRDINEHVRGVLGVALELLVDYH